MSEDQTYSVEQSGTDQQVTAINPWTVGAADHALQYNTASEAASIAMYGTNTQGGTYIVVGPHPRPRPR